MTMDCFSIQFLAPVSDSRTSRQKKKQAGGFISMSLQSVCFSNIFPSVIIVTIVQVYERNRKGNKMRNRRGNKM